MKNTKLCNKCNTEKFSNDFSKNRSTRDGLAVYCKSCFKILSKNYKPSVQALERKRDRNKEWKKNNKSLTREYDRNLLNEWRKNNPLKASEHALTRRASKINATPDWLNESDRDYILNLCILRSELELKNRIKYHIDHIVPLQGKNVCGLHVPWNLQVITAEENCAKGNKFIEELGINLSAPFYT